MPTPPVADEWLVRLPGLDRLWLITKGRADVRVAVLDGPAHGPSLAHGAVEPSSVAAHGTHVQSIIAGSADASVPGLASGCAVLALPIFEDGDGAPACTQQRLAEAIDEALEWRANIINVSAAQHADLLALSSDLSRALQAARQRDVLVVAAAGNHGCACETIPASVAGVLAVGAHDQDGRPLLSSNWGFSQRTQGITAPGRDVPGACVGGGLCRATGTSFATAVVSGIAALLMSADLEGGRRQSGARTRRLLLDTAERPRTDEVELAGPHLAGRLDVARAVTRLLATTDGAPGEGSLRMSNTEDEEIAEEPAAAQAGKHVPYGTSARRGGSPAAEITPAAELVPAHADCGCGGGGGECTCAKPAPAQLVYAIGRLGISFVSQARRDAIWRSINGGRDGDLKPIGNEAMQKLFKEQPYQAQSVIWTLSRTEVPMYAIVPSGAFAKETYRWLVDEWKDADVEFASIPGVLAGQLALYDGQVVDALIPDLRGMYSWETKGYVKALRDARRRADADLSEKQVDREIERFLGKIYFSIRNRGQSPEERAINAAATNAFNISPVIQQAGEEGLTLRDIGVERSPLNRPGSAYYDVLLTFFNPHQREAEAPLRARFTFDVSDTVPVPIGEPVLWHEY